MTDQLTFDFDAPTPKKNNRLEIGDTVKVTAVPVEGQDVENFYYLQDNTGKVGKLVEILRGKVVCFRIQYPNASHAIFYEHEITKIEGETTNDKTIKKPTKTHK